MQYSTSRKSSGWRLWPQFYTILGIFAAFVTLGHFLFWCVKPGLFQVFWGLSLPDRALAMLGLYSADQMIALGFSLVLTLLAGPWLDTRPGRILALLAVALVSLASGVSLLLACFSHASNLYLGSFLDLALMFTVLLQIQQWFLYSHHADPSLLYILFGAGAFGIGLLFWLLSRPLSGPVQPSGRRAAWAAALNVCLLGLSLSLIQAKSLQDLFYSRLAPELYAASRLMERSFDVASLDRYTEARRQISEKDYAARVAATPTRNVILVMVESWASARSGFLGNARPTTPNLDRLARESVVFPNAFSVSSHSEYGQMAIVSSLHPLKYPYHDAYSPIRYPRVLLHNVLHALGYRTAMFSSQDERWNQILDFLSSGGWDKFWYAMDFQGPHYGFGFESKILDEYTVAEALPWIHENRERPFFLYLNFQKTHFPYETPPPWNRVFEPSDLPEPWSFYSWPDADRGVVHNRYDDSLRYLDAQVGKLMDGLRRDGLEQNTLIVVVGDHGENLGSKAPPSHCCQLSLDEVNPGLMLRIPGRTPSVELRPVSTLDVAPTVAGLLGVPPHPLWQGVDALSAASASHPPIHIILDIAVKMDGVIDWPWKLAVNRSQRTMSLSNLQLDPLESKNLWDSKDLRIRRRGEELLRKLSDFRACQFHYYSTESLLKEYYVTCQ